MARTKGRKKRKSKKRPKTANEMSFLEIAVECVETGFTPVPVRNGKPMEGWSPLVHGRVDVNAVCQHWQQFPHDGIAVAGLSCLDVDARKVESLDRFKAFTRADEHPRLRSNVCTGRDAGRYFYRAVPGAASQELAPGLVYNNGDSPVVFFDRGYTDDKGFLRTGQIDEPGESLRCALGLPAGAAEARGDEASANAGVDRPVELPPTPPTIDLESGEIPPRENIPEVLATATTALTLGMAPIPVPGGVKGDMPTGWGEFCDRPAREQEFAHWTEYGCWGGLALACGSEIGTSIVALDFDVGFESSSESNELYQAALQAAGYVERSPRGGLHTLFRCAGGFPARIGALPKVDVLGHGRCVIVAPTKNYETIRGDLTTIKEMPPDLEARVLSLVTKPQPPLTKGGVRARADGNHGEMYAGAPKGRRNETGARVAGSLITRICDHDMALAAFHDWNERNTPPMDDSEVVSIFESIWKRHQAREDRRDVPARDDANSAGTPAAAVGDTAMDLPSSDIGTGVLIMRKAANIIPEPTFWLWKPYIPAGEITILDGDPGVGKSSATLDMATRVTLGKSFPGHFEPTTPGDVLLLTYEDSPAKTIVPRLQKAGADLDRVHIIEGQRRGNTAELVTFRDLDVLEEALIRVRPRLVIVDPIDNAIGGETDMNAANSVRGVLTPVARLAAKHNVAIVIVRHLRKASADRAVYRGLGSIAFSGIARSILLAGVTPDGGRAMAHAKSNLAAPGPSLSYAIDDNGFAWGSIVQVTAADILTRVETGKKRTQIAEDFLEAVLADGPVPAEAVKAQARAGGISKHALEKAKARLGVTHRQEPRKDAGRGMGPSVWSLPGDEQDEPESSSSGVGETDDDAETETSSSSPDDHTSEEAA